MRDGLLEYMMSLVLSDKEIAKEEIGLIYRFGSDIGFTEKEISVKFASMIQRKYVPSLESICWEAARAISGGGFCASGPPPSPLRAKSPPTSV